ncbi:MAG TPA: calcium/proton exchanger [Chloroflexota bacterium]
MASKERRESGQRPHNREIGLARFLMGSRLNLFLVLVPVSIAVELLHLPRLWLFIASSLAVIPLAALIGAATEEIAHRVGPVAGGLLNATFGNAPELIIALLALRAGLQEVVKASITGSIVGNILLVLGASMLAGGWGRDVQRFNRTGPAASASMLVLAVVALVMPATFSLTVYGSLRGSAPAIQLSSLLVAIVLMVTYLASLLFSLRTHRELFSSVPQEVDAGAPRPSQRSAVVLLLVAAAVVAVEAELMVEAIHDATAALGMTEFFVGVVVVAIVGNAAEHSSAVVMAMKNRMDIAVTIACGSSTQIALFVAPVLVIASFLIGQPMTLVFNAFEIAAIALSVIVLSIITLDGESNWFEGLQLLAVYLVLAIVFFFVPPV